MSVRDSINRFFAAGSLGLRAVQMLLFAFVAWVALWLAFILVAVQFTVVLFAGSANTRLLQFGRNLAAYLYQCLAFITFNTDAPPFPFAPWPEAKPGSKPWQEAGGSATSTKPKTQQ